MTDAKQLTDWVYANTHERVQRNVTVVTPKDLGQDYLLHISFDTNIRNFIPRIGNRQAGMEDRTVPRVTTAPSIMGCMIGYADTEGNFMYNNGDLIKEDKWKGGWKIYALPFAAALKPNAKMVYDTRSSDEHWLVRYNDDTGGYKPEAVGKMFYRSIAMVARNGKAPTFEGSLYVEVTRAEGLAFSGKIFLTKGYWLIEGPTAKNIFSWKDDKDFTAKEIDEAEFKAQKNACAALLGITDPVPAYLSW